MEVDEVGVEATDAVTEVCLEVTKALYLTLKSFQNVIASISFEKLKALKRGRFVSFAEPTNIVKKFHPLQCIFFKASALRSPW